MDIYLILYLLFFVAPVSTLIHESGHLFGATIAKAERIKLSLGVGKRIIIYARKKILVTIRLLFFISGHTESERKSPYHDVEIAFITFLGPLFNIIFAIVFYFFYCIFMTEHLLLFVLFNGWLAIVNLIPFNIKGKKSDGFIIIDALFKRNKI